MQGKFDDRPIFNFVILKTSQFKLKVMGEVKCINMAMANFRGCSIQNSDIFCTVHSIIIVIDFEI
jgi:hypothetical protein